VPLVAKNAVTYRYRSAVLEQLWQHGVQPTPQTRPELVHEFVSDLYRFELRRLRDRLVRKIIPKAGYLRSRCGAATQVPVDLAEARAMARARRAMI
jgi:hypothetical protein